MSPPARDPKFASSPEPSLDEARARFLAACESGSGDGQPPDLEAFLAPFEEPEYSSLRAQLEEIKRKYESKESATPSGDLAAKGTKSNQTAETKRTLAAEKVKNG
jgi:hypothetical protein